MLKVENLCKSFGTKEVLNNISFEVKSGERLVIIGPSGCGKSTLLRCINFIEPMTKGKIYFNNEEITNSNLNLIRENTGMVFQSFNLFNNLNVLDNIILAPTVNSIISKERAIVLAKKYLREFGLIDKIDSFPSMLSGGEKQRVAIIRVLILNPKLMLFDEPTSALDPEKKEESFELLKSLSNMGIAVIVVTHEMAFIKEFASRIIFIENGKIIVNEEQKNLLQNKNKRLNEFLNTIYSKEKNRESIKKFV